MKIRFFPESKLKNQWSDPTQVEKHWKLFLDNINNEATGFFHVTKRRDLLQSCKEVYEKFQTRKNFIQIGIGGSSLGPEMLVSALGDGKRRFEFINNIDPDYLTIQLRDLDPKETLFYFVSKSGGTAEMSAAMAIICSWLKERGYSEKDFPELFVFATDPKKSNLLELGKDWGIHCLEIPQNIGGRFSVLTPVGLLPALFAGINPSELIEGAESYQPTILNPNLSENLLVQMANFLMGSRDEGTNQTVLMPYSSRLRDLSFWFVQLWAESLGKLKEDGSPTGFTPLPSYGATDQHSQVQLFMEGPRDKVLLFVEIESFDQDFSLHNEIDSPSLKKLSPYKLSQLMSAELKGTLKAMEEKKRPYIHFSLSRLNAQNLGQMILFLESLTVITGGMLSINPFNQPGVEAGKIFAFEYLQQLNS